METHRIILIFLKYPEPGRVKSRLGKTIGNEEAAAVYRTLVDRVLETVSRCPAEEVRVMFDPPEAESITREWLGETAEEWTFIPQVTGDLGARLSAGFIDAFNHGASAVAAIGTDCIEISEQTFEQTWKELEIDGDRAVFGPTFDGGYYLIGLNSHCDAVFQGIPWSAENTLAASIAAADTAGLTVSLLEQLSDIDHEEDLTAARSRGLPI